MAIRNRIFDSESMRASARQVNAHKRVGELPQDPRKIASRKKKSLEGSAILLCHGLGDKTLFESNDECAMLWSGPGFIDSSQRLMRSPNLIC